MEPEIIFEDNHLLVVVKPPGCLAQADGRPPGRPDVLGWGKNYLKTKYHKPGAVYLGLTHRLDLWAGGLMALAKTSKAAARLSGQFRDRSPEKIYLALAETRPGGRRLPGSSGWLEHFLFRDGRVTRLAAGPEQGVPARLGWKAVRGGGGLTLFSLKLITGFKHQIRAQLAWGLERPLVGDTLYGARARPGKPKAIGLWAARLSLSHPTLKTRLTFQSFPPAAAWPFRLLPVPETEFWASSFQGPAGAD